MNRKWLTGNTFSGKGFKPVEPPKQQIKGTKDAPKPLSIAKLSDDSKVVFTCPKEGCVKMFQSYGHLSNHLDHGKCIYKLEKETLLDKAKIQYASKLLNDDSRTTTAHAVSSNEMATASLPSLPNGWALRGKRKAVRFNTNQKRFLDEKFDKGEQTGKKFDPLQVSLEMRVAKDKDGKRMFCVEQFLSEEQIKGYFSRRSSKKKHAQCQEDQLRDETEKLVGAVEEEELLFDMRDLVDKNIQILHPIVVDNYNICDLVKKKKLSRLGIPLLRSICETLDLPIGDITQKRKAPFIALLNDYVASCSCSSM